MRRQKCVTVVAMHGHASNRTLQQRFRSAVRAI
jgi:hypothetical protein